MLADFSWACRKAQQNIMKRKNRLNILIRFLEVKKNVTVGLLCLLGFAGFQNRFRREQYLGASWEVTEFQGQGILRNPGEKNYLRQKPRRSCTSAQQRWLPEDRRVAQRGSLGFLCVRNFWKHRLRSLTLHTIWFSRSWVRYHLFSHWEFSTSILMLTNWDLRKCDARIIYSIKYSFLCRTAQQEPQMHKDSRKTELTRTTRRWNPYN